MATDGNTEQRGSGGVDDGDEDEGEYKVIAMGWGEDVAEKEHAYTASSTGAAERARVIALREIGQRIVVASGEVNYVGVPIPQNLITELQRALLKWERP